MFCLLQCRWVALYYNAGLCIGSLLNRLQAMPKKQNIYLLACCYNEARLLPFFLDYYTHFIGVSRFFLFDGGSTDDTANIIRDYPVEMFVHKSDKLDDRQLMYFRNEGYKQWRQECDWFIVCDVDEFLYHPDIHAVLENYKTEGITVPLVEGFEMLSKKFPTFKKGDYLPNFIRTGLPNPAYYNKHLIFDPVIDINYTLGCHGANPTGPVRKSTQADFKNLHYKILSFEYFHSKAKSSSERISDWNKEVGAGFHYAEFAKKSENEFLQYFVNADNVFNNANDRIAADPLASYIAQHLLKDTEEFVLLDLSNSGRYASPISQSLQLLEIKFGTHRITIDHPPTEIDTIALSNLMSLRQHCNVVYLDISMLKFPELSTSEALTVMLSVLLVNAASRGILVLIDMAHSSAEVRDQLMSCEILLRRFSLSRYENMLLATQKAATD